MASLTGSVAASPVVGGPTPGVPRASPPSSVRIWTAVLVVTVALGTTIMVVLPRFLLHTPLWVSTGYFSTTKRGPGSSWCAYGSAAGAWTCGDDNSTWVHGACWQTVEPRCRLVNYLSLYSPNATGLPSQHPSSRSTSSSVPLVRPRRVGIVWLSDSVDKHILTYLCEYAGGSLRSIVSRDFVDPDNPPNISSYAMHTCSSVPGLNLMAAYFPGVHPTGPYHK